MKALTIWQPWASAIPAGLKLYETRCWKTNYRGPVAIHASKTQPKAVFEQGRHLVAQLLSTPYMRNFDAIPQGCIVAFATLVDCIPTEDIRKELYGQEIMWGDYSDGRYAWRLQNIEAIVPYPYTGGQRLWNASFPKGTRFKILD